MNAPDPLDPLSRTLASWRVEPPARADFRPAVWQRLQRSSQETWAAYIRAHSGRWTTVAALAIVAATWTGRAVAQAQLDAERERRVVSYLVELDPRVLALVQP